MIAYFVGVWPGERSGHFCYRPSGTRATISGRAQRSPWARPRWDSPADESLVLEAAWPGNYTATEHQPEGRARVVRQEGWTLLSLWDRSADPRLNSHSSFLLAQEIEPDAALAWARELFPAVFQRIERHLGRPVVLDEGRAA